MLLRRSYTYCLLIVVHVFYSYLHHLLSKGKRNDAITKYRKQLLHIHHHHHYNHHLMFRKLNYTLVLEKCMKTNISLIHVSSPNELLLHFQTQLRLGNNQSKICFNDCYFCCVFHY